MNEDKEIEIEETDVGEASSMPKKKKRKKLTLGNVILTLVFIVGFLVMIYPLISQLYYYRTSAHITSEFEQGVEELDTAEIDHRIEMAHAFNETLHTTTEGLHDPYSEEEKQQGRAEYARMLEVKEQIGNVRIPKIMLKAPIYAGTTEEVLQKGIGHLEGTSLPVGGNSTHTVITGHRGLPSARLFTDLDKVEVGDRFYIKNIKETLAYQVEHIQVIEPHEFEHLTIVPGHDYATLLTCTPYMINSHRLIIRGHRVPYIEAQEEKDIKDNEAAFMYKYLFFGTLAVLVLVLLRQFRQYLRERKEKKRLAKLNQDGGMIDNEKVE